MPVGPNTNRDIVSCPFCGSSDTIIKSLGLEGYKSAVLCQKCGTHGPEQNTAIEAVIAWNFLRTDRSLCEIQRCPFCGSDNVNCITNDSTEEHCVKCESCNSKGPVIKYTEGNIFDAIRKWNKADRSHTNKIYKSGNALHKSSNTKGELVFGDHVDVRSKNDSAWNKALYVGFKDASDLPVCVTDTGFLAGWEQCRKADW